MQTKNSRKCKNSHFGPKFEAGVAGADKWAHFVDFSSLVNKIDVAVTENFAYLCAPFSPKRKEED